ncbi:hypothetical protein OnM2_068044 [Erysiphe neolycopersici]|uniref:Uncharacterized protein n=1 Tax=Erysiphe neolycopersici TaxID=212602 RepID=A0A420HLU9_9PEZI|nr:hypothetical protein OnM2_068044 [Erysiphe neolycopersici]
MTSMVQSGHFFCLGCQVVLPSIEICNVHYSICPRPNIQCIALIPTPPQAGDANKNKKDGMPAGNKTNDENKDGMVRIHGNEKVTINNYYRPKP